jgi:hypothetical protein
MAAHGPIEAGATMAARPGVRSARSTRFCLPDTIGSSRAFCGECTSGSSGELFGLIFQAAIPAKVPRNAGSLRRGMWMGCDKYYGILSCEKIYAPTLPG